MHVSPVTKALQTSQGEIHKIHTINSGKVLRNLKRSRLILAYSKVTGLSDGVFQLVIVSRSM